ncbi:MAG: hypothetical protein H5T76_18680 [Streptomyces sp.]|nr:hypothetical protein [Streptomyces sp.]
MWHAHTRRGWETDDAYAGIVLSSVLTIASAGAAAALWLMPSVRGTIPWWWMLPALLLGVVAGARG